MQPRPLPPRNPTLAEAYAIKDAADRAARKKPAEPETVPKKPARKGRAK